MKKYKYIFVSGGVLSGLGKGVTAASIGLLLKSHGYKVAIVKCDPYVNIDAGTIRPQEHGEVFVTEDGIESDQDLGHYERFINENLSRAHYVTTGQIYQEVIKKERNFEYCGEDVEVVPHVPEEMIRRFKLAGEASNADVVIIEIGGTVGEYQNILFLEANRILKMREKEEVIHVHVGYLPTPPSIGEMKSKPVQISVRLLNQTGIQPDFLVGRATKSLDIRRKKRISLFC
ncbi:MAG TPA: CTP synthase, partial [Candidatus Bathyarchaeia archaeon]|nr:CTP synthase [Candidatus Bathyarchaeia archaeon]